MTIQDQRDKAICDLAIGLKAALDRKPETPEQKRSSFWVWADTPFAITLLTGLLGTGLTLVWGAVQQRGTQKAAAQKAAIEAKQLDFQRRHEALCGGLLKFINEFPSSLARTYNYQRTYLAVKEHRDHSTRNPVTNQTFSELWADYKKREELALTPPVIDSFAPQIMVTFHSEKVREDVGLLGKKVRELNNCNRSEAATSAKLNAILAELNGLYESLISDMSVELNQHTQATEP